MARVISSGLGHISGRIGDHIFYAVGDKRYVRRAPIKVSNPRSPAQCLQRWRQVCVQTLFRSVKGTLFQRAAGEAAVQLGKRSGYHLFLSRNINAFGEELMVDNADKAISKVSRQTGAIVKEYTAAPLFMLDKAKGRHQWFIEFEKMPPSMEEFASLLDKTLQELNSDYEAKRYKEISLQPLEITIAHEGAFYEWLKEKGKLGGQHKIPRLSNDRTHIEQLLAINKQLS